MIKRTRVNIDEIMIEYCIRSAIELILPNDSFDVTVDISKDNGDIDIVIDKYDEG